MIYNRQTIVLLMRLCKLVSDEFGVRLHLDDPNIVSKMKSIVADGASQQTLAVWREIRHQIAPQEAPTPQSSPHRIYRGQNLDDALSDKPMAPPVEARPKSVRIYRGRVVT